jgi:hypothetical protein
MKTLKSIQTRINQINNNSLTLKNQKVMKTKKYSISMKALAAVVFTFAFSALLNAQWLTPDPDSPTFQAVSEEVRYDASGLITVTYDVDDNHVLDDQYRWVVTGGTITDAGGAPITGGNTIVEFTANAHTITVNWSQAPGTANTHVDATIQVQKINSGACPSQIHTLDIDVWNPATATITTGIESICSDAGASITDVPVALTGAPDAAADGTGFSVSYSFTIPAGLTVFDALDNDITGTTTGTVPTDDLTVDIPLPARFVNSGAAAVDFVVNLTAMNDDFTGPGAITGTYTITVNPVPATGDIQSTSSLTRRL